MIQITAPHAETSKVEAFGFKAPRPDIYRQFNVAPFHYQGNPIKFNSFLLWPNLTLEQEYNDNVLALENDAKEDFVTTIKPSITIKKYLNKHEAILSLNAEMRRHWDLKNEDVENYSALLQGKLEASQTTHVPLTVSFRDGHIQRRTQRRSSINDLSVNPLHVQSYQIETGIVHKPNRLSLSLLGHFRQAKFSNGLRRDGSTLTRDTRNIAASQITGRISYKTPYIWEPITELTLAHNNFTNQPAGSVSRNNNLIRLLLGGGFNYKGLIYGFAGAGWENRFYKNNNLENAGGLTFDAKIHWEPQIKTKLSFYSSQETFEANEIIAGITRTEAELELQHELQRNLFFKLMGTYDVDNFDEISRKDVTYGTGLGVNYISGPRLQLGADYNFTRRNSTLSGLDLDNNIFMVRAKTFW